MKKFLLTEFVVAGAVQNYPLALLRQYNGLKIIRKVNQKATTSCSHVDYSSIFYISYLLLHLI